MQQRIFIAKPMTYLHKASRCLTTLFGGGMMGQGSVGIFNGHSPLYLNLLHRMRDPMTITGDIMIIMGKQLQVKHFGAAHPCNISEIWNGGIFWGKHGLQSACINVRVFELLAAFLGRYLGISIWSQCWVQDIAIPQTKIDSACNKPQVFFVQEIVTEAWLYNWI